jgi:hypothetical protein
MKSIVGTLLAALLLSAAGCGESPSVQKPGNPTPPPAAGPQSATTSGGEHRLD